MKKLLLMTASAGLIAMAGPALAQTGGVAPGTGSPGMERERSSPGATGAQLSERPSPDETGAQKRESTSPSATGAQQRNYPGATGAQPGAIQDAMQDATPPANVIGKTLRGSEGENIGEIEAVEGNNVIVSVGGFLGIGARDVAIPWNQVTMMGSGEDAELQTSLTREQLREMPEHEKGSGAMQGGAAR